MSGSRLIEATSLQRKRHLTNMGAST